MKIDIKTWDEYIAKLRRINRRAATEMEALLNRLKERPNLERREETIVDYAFRLATRYGEAAGAAACEMYDAIASASGRNVPPADPADTATFAETAKAIRGTIKNQSEDAVPSTVGRLVKQVGADTMLNNAARDGAQFAWVPHGDTCPFCIMLASNGWQYVSKKTLRRGHAEHIHANCDCEYAVRFSEQDGVAGYDPDQYREIYDNADGYNWEQKLRSMQHDRYDAHKDERNARRREIYAEKKAQKTIEKARNNDTMLSRIGEHSSVINPMPADEYSTMVKRLERTGKHVIQAQGDDLAYLRAAGAEGSYSHGYIMHIGQIPSRATLLEEIIHSTQAKKYGELATSDIAERAAREIAANKMLLKHRQAYRLDAMDIEDTERNLKFWMAQFEAATGESYEASSLKREI